MTLSFQTSPTIFKLIGHELRWKLLTSLIASDRNVQELVQQLKEKQNLISYHLKKLQGLNLVKEHRSLADGRETYYSVSLDNLQYAFFAAGDTLHPALNPQVQEGEGQFANLHAPVRVLFLCTHNSARSQMAEGILRAQGRDLVEVFSAGNQPSGIHPLAVRAMQKLNIDITGQQSKTMDQVLDQKFDFVITVCDKAKESCPIFPGDPNMIHWSFPDPSEAHGDEETRARVFEDTAAELTRRISYLLMMIKRSLK